MRSWRTRALAAGLLVAIAGCDLDTQMAPDTVPPINAAVGSATAGQYIVLFRHRAVPGDFSAQVQALGGSVTAVWPKVGIAAVRGLDATGARRLGTSGAIEAVEDDAMLTLEEVSGRVEAIAGGAVASPDNPAGAVGFPRQWNMRLIQADLAWAAGKLGDPGVMLAILDTGIDYLYPDLAGRVDLARSVSFIASDDALVATMFPGRHPVTDLHWHGTHVAATAVSNALILAGVTSKTTLIGVKVCNQNGSCPTSSVLGGILYAADAGADVANLSLGGAFSKRIKQNAGFVSVINRVLNYAQQQGMLVVVAAGNAAIDMDHNGPLFHTYCDGPGVVCVSAVGPIAGAGTNGPWTDPDAFAGYSNYGRSAISVAAPGGNLGGPVWSGCSTSSLQIPICQLGIFVLASNGTSMASPHVAGIAALLARRYDNPSLLRAKIQQTADDILQRGTDPFSGKGRVNAAWAAGAH